MDGEQETTSVLPGEKLVGKIQDVDWCSLWEWIHQVRLFVCPYDLILVSSCCYFFMSVFGF